MGIQPVRPINMNMVHDISASIIYKRMRKYGLSLKETLQLMSVRELVNLENKIVQDIVRRNLMTNHTERVLTNSTKFNLKGFEAIA